MGKDYRVQTLENAHGMFRSATNAAMYAEAAKQFEYLVHEENIVNGHLFYTLGNSWFMAGDVGRAILNYRRAEQHVPNSEDVHHNLNAALALRTDLIPQQDPHPFAASVLGWHTKTSAALRGWLFAGCWLLFWSAWLWTSRSVKKEARITAYVAGILSVILMGSLLAETWGNIRRQPGVIVAEEVVARKGDAAMYAPAFREPLHAGTEFTLREVRGMWWHIQLADGQACWIPASAAETVALTFQ
ncbi:MAG: hypothetical protein KJN98_00975 [Pontiella sp.]|nr:hypothetical protein [Pontiella sp.]